MPDEETFDFDASLEAKLAAVDGASEETTPEAEVTEVPEAPEEGEPEGRQRDEQGRFVAVEKESEPDSEAQALQNVLDKFGGDPQKLAQAYRELERWKGEQSQEIQELRKTIEERLPEDDEYDYTPSFDPETADFVTRLVQAGRFQEAAVYAAQSGNAPLYNQTLDDWYDEQPRHAAAFERKLEMAQLQKTFESQMEPVQQQTSRTEFQQAWGQVSQAHPDMKELADQIMEAAKTSPEIVSALGSGTQESKQRVIESLYWMVRGRNSDNLATAAEEVARQTQEETRQAKTEATVASGSSSPTREEEKPKTRADRIKAGIMAESLASVSRGLTSEE